MAAVAEQTKWILKIKTLKIGTLEIEIHSNAKVSDLKQQIHELKQFPTKLQRLIFRGKILKDDKTLTECGISNGCNLHLVVGRPSQSSSSSSFPSRSQSYPPSDPIPVHVQQAMQAAFQQIHLEYPNGHPNGNPIGSPNGRNANGMNPNGPRPVFQIHRGNGRGPRRGFFIHRRMPRHRVVVSPHCHPDDNDNDDDGENDDEQKRHQQRAPMNLKQADYASMDNLDGNGNVNHSVNVIRWKLKRKKLQKWIRSGGAYEPYFSPEFEANNNSIWRLFVYPKGINQMGYQSNFVLFISLEELPYGVDSMDTECNLQFEACSVDFSFRKHFTPQNRSAGWSRGKLLSQQVLDVNDDEKWFTLTCRLTFHSVTFKNEPCSNLNYLRYKVENPQSVFSLKHHLKPNGARFRWTLNKTEMAKFKSLAHKQCMVSKRFKIKWFKWYLQLYPNGLTQPHCVQPYVHCMKMPKMIKKVEAAYSFYIHEAHIGYYHVDSFDGKLGKGWPERRLLRGDKDKNGRMIDWDKLSTLTIDCRVNILSISVKAEQYFGGDPDEPQSSIAASAANVDSSEATESKSNEMEEEGNGDHVAPAAPAVVHGVGGGHSSNGDEEKEDPENEADGVRFEKWLKEEVGLGQYLEMFRKNEIHSLDDVVEYIEEKSNLGEIGIKAFAHKTKVWRSILKLKEEQHAAEDPDRADEFIGDPSSGSAFEF